MKQRSVRPGGSLAPGLSRGTRPPGLILAALLLAPLVLTTNACGDGGPRRSGDPALDVEVGFSPTPPAVGRAGVRVEARDAGAPLDGSARVRVGVGSDPAAWDTLTPGDAGSWTGMIRFRDPGLESVRVELMTDDGRSAAFLLPVTVSAAPASPPSP